MNIQRLKLILNELGSEYDDCEVRAEVSVEFNPENTNLWLYAFTPIRKGNSGYEQNGEFVFHFSE